MSPETFYRERPTLRRTVAHPPFRIEERAWFVLHGVPVQDHSAQGKSEGLYVVEVVNGWKLNYGEQRTGKGWMQYLYDRCDDKNAFFPATAPQLASIVDTLYQHQHEPAHAQMIERLRNSFPHTVQFATNSYVQYIPGKDDSVLHTSSSVDRDYKMSEHITGQSAFLKDDGAELARKCKAVLGTRAVQRLAQGFKWLTGSDAVFVPHEHKTHYCARTVAFGNREQLRDARFYTIDADTETTKELYAVGIRIREKIA